MNKKTILGLFTACLYITGCSLLEGKENPFPEISIDKLSYLDAYETNKFFLEHIQEVGGNPQIIRSEILEQDMEGNELIMNGDYTGDIPLGNDGLSISRFLNSDGQYTLRIFGFEDNDLTYLFEEMKIDVDSGEGEEFRYTHFEVVDTNRDPDIGIKAFFDIDLNGAPEFAVFSNIIYTEDPETGEMIAGEFNQSLTIDDVIRERNLYLDEKYGSDNNFLRPEIKA